VPSSPQTPLTAGKEFALGLIRRKKVVFVAIKHLESYNEK
jgi:hypothetical protein